ncbi:hypothetical protein CALCODRAFT_493974 [Calocera cornea HHB12733]|uniref:Uncharacterized protein n=1 Tax=Calocera cornea HHB12733 TaxID=1353952 RepID=A0A165HE02_9BASI|nr:hypothetical protein CALCODRAFT_493974 [Calocera cornea HHB12733]
MHGSGTSMDAAEARARLLSRAAQLTSELGEMLDSLGSTSRPADPASSSHLQLPHLSTQLSTALHSLGEKRNLALSPICRLPDDLLLLIFLVPSSQRTLALAQRSFALTVSAVCTRWRALALSCAPLWACLRFVSGGGVMRPAWQHLHLSDPEDIADLWNPLQRELRSERLFLERAKLAPLTVQLDLSRGNTGVSLPAHPDVPQIPADFPTFAPRIEDLKLSAVPYQGENVLDLYSQVLASVRSSVRLLELSLYVPAPVFTLDFFAHPFPRLEALAMSMIPVRGSIALPALAHIRSLELQTATALLDPPGLRSLLASAPELRALRLQTHIAFPPDLGFTPASELQRTHVPRVRLPNLRTLHWEVAKWAHLPLEMLDAPCLAELTLVVENGIGRNMHDDFNTTLRSFLGEDSTVRELALKGIPAECALTMFFNLLHVTSLALGDCSPKLVLGLGPDGGATVAPGLGIPQAHVLGILAPLAPPLVQGGPSSSAQTPPWYDGVLRTLRGLRDSGSSELAGYADDPQHPLLPRLEVVDIWQSADAPVLDELLALISIRKQLSSTSDIRHVKLGMGMSPNEWLAAGDNVDTIRQMAEQVETLQSGRFCSDKEAEDWVSRWK